MTNFFSTLISINWIDIFTPDASLLEIAIRGTVLYMGIFILMRFMPRRTGAELGVMDLIFILLVSEAASNSMGDYKSVTDGVIMILVFLFWDMSINALSYHFKFFEKLLNSSPIVVIKEGRMLRKNMRKEFLSEKELMAQVREQGIEHLSDVKLAIVEGEGEISIFKYEEKEKADSKK